MSWIAGIDYSTHAIDVVVIDEDNQNRPQWHHWDLEGHDAFERARYVDHALASTNTWGDMWDDIVAAGIEDPRGHGAGSLYRVQGALLASVYKGTLVHPMIPSHWRKLAGVPGNASKGLVKSQSRFLLMAQWSYTQDDDEANLSRTYYPGWLDQVFTTWPQDACDAHCIAEATRVLIQQGRVAA